MARGRAIGRQRYKRSRGQKIWGWIKFFALVIFVAGLVLAIGFVGFAQRVDALKPPALSAVSKADGIVVWTGKGGGRLEAGADLLKADKGERLLISGVNTDLTSETLFELLDIPDAKKDCCIDLDYAAEDTIGNARETAAWAEALGYEHILLVTSSYHMPRAQNEINAAKGRIRITPYPVSRSEDNHWYSDKARMKRLLNEYAKLLLAIMRSADKIERDGTPNTPLPKPDA